MGDSSKRRPLVETAALAALGGLAGCAEPSEREASGQTGIDPGSISDSSATAGGGETEPGMGTGGTGAGSGTATGDDGGPGGDHPSFDLGAMPDVDPPDVELGCHKVDFLFVIDNSGSMADDQQNLADNFPGFIDGIQATLDQVDSYHVGVVTTDAYFPNAPGCNVLGGLVVQTGGADSSNMGCGPFSEGNYMTEQDDLAADFSCAAKVGSEGLGMEKPMNAMEAVVRGDVGGPGECNEGFIRDDALLVVTVITDEWDGPGDPEIFGSSGNAGSWYQSVVDAKNGHPENVVVLSLVHFLPGCPPGEQAFLSGDIEPFTEMFGDNGYLGCIDADYGALFAEATSVIEGACTNFVPPG